mgnify:FL=1
MFLYRPQRLQKYFSQDHPMSPNISLEKLNPSEEDLKENWEVIGGKLAKLFQLVDNVEFGDIEESISNIAEAAIDERYGNIGRRRLFTQSMCEGLDLLSRQVEKEITLEIAKKLVKNMETKLLQLENETEEEESEDKEY